MPQTKPYATIYPAYFAYNGKTYSMVVGGPQGVNAEQGGTNIPLFSGNARWPVLNPIVEHQAALTIELSEFDEDIPIGIKDTVSLNLELPDGTAVPLPFYNMRFAGSTAGQTFGRYSTRVLRFVFEAANGIGLGPRNANG
jgi:hypothetical protein